MKKSEYSKKSHLEALMWQQLKALGLCPEHEYRFHPVRRWRFDFAFPDIKLAIECEGGTWLKKGGHTTGKGYERDCEKYNMAAIEGWKVLRFTGNMIKSGMAIDMIEKCVDIDLDCLCRRAGL